MKYIFYNLIIFLLSVHHLFAQSCLPDRIVFSTQEDIDNFALDYAGCTQISGDIIIGSKLQPTAIKNLNGLNSITYIEGSLTIEDNDSLKNLIGLENIHTINGGLTIQFNYLLNSLYGLRNLTALGEDLAISVNDSLPDLTGLEGLSVINGNVVIDNNDGLINLTGLNNLTNIDGDFYIQYNDKLFNLVGLENLTNIQESLQVWYNTTLVNIRTFNNLKNVKDLSIIGNYKLLNLDGLNNLSTIPNDLAIKHNTDLLSFSGLNTLSSIGGYLQIHDNAVTDFTGLNNLNTVGKYIAVSQNPNLLNFSGLDNLSTIGQYLFVGENLRLTSLAGIQNLSHINGYLWVRSNRFLDDIEALEQIDYTTITDLRIYGNPNLDFCNLENVCNYLTGTNPSTIHDNETNCHSVSDVKRECGLALPIELLTFEGYIERDGAVLIWETASETNNKGFEIQKSIDGINWKIIDWVNGRGNSTILTTYKHIDNTFKEMSYYRLKQIDFDDNFEYSKVINLKYISDEIIVYPNPVKDILYINQEIESIKIYDHLGKLIFVEDGLSDDVDVSTLSKGMYIAKITIKGKHYYKKFIKQSQ